MSPAQGSEIDFGDGTWVPVPPEDGRVTRLRERDTIVRVRNECCESKEAPARVGQTDDVAVRRQPRHRLEQHPARAGVDRGHAAEVQGHLARPLGDLGETPQDLLGAGERHGALQPEGAAPGDLVEPHRANGLHVRDGGVHQV